MAIEIIRLDGNHIEPYWREMRRLWQGDHIRRPRPVDLEAFKRALILGTADGWLAWSDPPLERGEFGGPRQALAIVAAVRGDGHMWAHYACGRAIESWRQAMADAITQYAFEHQISRLHVLCRKGWKQHLGDCWSFPAEAVTLHTDPGALPMAREALRATA